MRGPGTRLLSGLIQKMYGSTTKSSVKSILSFWCLTKVSDITNYHKVAMVATRLFKLKIKSNSCIQTIYGDIALRPQGQLNRTITLWNWNFFWVQIPFNTAFNKQYTTVVHFSEHWALKLKVTLDKNKYTPHICRQIYLQTSIILPNTVTIILL